MSSIKGKIILVTGGTGSFGQAFILRALKEKPRKLICYSRDEYKQIEMDRRIEDPEKRIRYFIADIRDKCALWRALTGVDYVVHTAALKHVSKCEYSPFEAVKTNVIGAQNLVDVAIDRGVKKVLTVSSDKAVNPISLYGATKLCADKLFIAANAYSGLKGTKFSVVRFGNFKDSRGSVFEYYSQLAKGHAKEMPVTDMRMTRFVIDLKEAGELVLAILEIMNGREVFSPKMSVFRVMDLAKAKAPDTPIKVTGRKLGEKFEEELIGIYEAPDTYECERWYVTCPYKWSARKVPEDFVYSSGRAEEWLKASELL